MTEFFDMLTVRNTLRLVILVMLFGYCIFSFFLLLRVRILAQTLKTDKSWFINLLAQIHALVVVVGSIIVSILVLF
ncbi:hypothetical protein JW710_03860 [Candidatus Dojkabacteria bacterium]|nr:hypothetical protein [Candidatus Dojkabacteria bacterium]